MKSAKFLFYAFIIYTLFYLILFIPFPLKNSIAGYCDTWLIIALNNYLNNFLSTLFTSAHFTTSMYPVENALYWGETSLGCLGILNFYRLFGCNDITSWYFFVVTIYALNGAGVFLLSFHYTKNFLASLIAGFFFSCSNFAFVNIDDINIAFYFLPLLSVFFLLKYHSLKKNNFLVLATFMMGLQIYVSLYVFVYGFVIFAVLFIYVLNFFRGIDKKLLLVISGCVVLFFLLTTPFITFYLHIKKSPDFYNPVVDWPRMIELSYIRFSDFFKVMTNNLIYTSPFSEYDDLVDPCTVRRSVFIGFLFMGITLYSLIKFYRQYTAWIIVAGSGLLLSMTSFKYITYVFPFFEALRLPYRGYFISVIAFSVISSVGLSYILDKFTKKKKIIIVLVILLIHFTENIPYPFPKLNIQNTQKNFTAVNVTVGDGFRPAHLIPSDDLIKTIKEIDENSVILCLPSNNIFGNKASGALSYSREVLYMNHQTYFNRNMFNGVNGYYPKTRVLLQNYIDELPKDLAFQQLISFGLTHLLFYKNMFLTQEEDILDTLKKSNMLYLIKETSDIVFFEVIKK